MSTPDFVYMTGDLAKTPLTWDAFLAQPEGTMVTLVSHGTEYPFRRQPGPVRVIWVTSDVSKTPITREALAALPPDTSITVSNNGREFISQAGTAVIPPLLTMAGLSLWVKTRSGDRSSSNKPSDPTTF